MVRQAKAISKEPKQAVKYKILYIDDEPQALFLFEEFFRLSYEVLTATSGEEGLKILKQNPDIAVIVTDQRMPEMSGVEFFEKILPDFPNPIRIVLTGYANVEDIIAAINTGKVFYYIQKPWSESQLKLVIDRAVEYYDLTLRNIRLLGDLQRMMNGTVYAIALMVERRDPYTAGHQQKVSQLAAAIIKELGFSEDQVEGIRIAGLLHDVGKISVPAEILSKPGRISEYEFNIIKTHTQVGYEILKGIEFPWPVAEIALQHHERLDGSGYPSGLSGEEILFEARVMAVADTVEAMSSHRPYRPALGVDKALDEISRGRDVFYDAEAVDACVRVFKKKGFKFEA
jgi:putative nucleotidyltransferase with HDIG domain